MLKVLLSACLLAVAFGKSIPSAIDEENENYVVGGDDSDSVKVPYQAAFLVSQSFKCNAAIISPNFVITAAQCIEKDELPKMSVRVGSFIHAFGGKEYKVKNFTVYPDFNAKAFDGDLALLQLEKPLKFSKKVKSIKVATSEPKNDVKAFLSGWGKVGETDLYPDTIQSVVIPIVDRETCKNNYKSIAEINENMICAGMEGKGSCEGDEGSPLVVNGELVGIASFGHGCGRKNFPGVSANIATPKLRQFIKSVANV